MYNPAFNTYATTGFGTRRTATTIATAPVRQWDGRMDLPRAIARALRAAENARTLPIAITPTPEKELHDAAAEGTITTEEATNMTTRIRINPHRVRAYTREGIPLDILAATPRIAKAIATHYQRNGTTHISPLNRKRVRKAVTAGILPPAVLRYL
ncbi:hypothetical protein ACFXKD_00385 [Nocardiopsis aegyptia]|uniref:hypothetical protein n=1 Tax=Nocardiopsis aegyptia TaxID=220378 RepID=UPI003671A963